MNNYKILQSWVSNFKCFFYLINICSFFQLNDLFLLSFFYFLFFCFLFFCFLFFVYFFAYFFYFLFFRSFFLFFYKLSFFLYRYKYLNWTIFLLLQMQYSVILGLRLLVRNTYILCYGYRC